MGSFKLACGKRISSIRIQERRRANRIEIQRDSSAKLPARQYHPREVQRRRRLCQRSCGHRLQEQRSRVRLDQRRLSGDERPPQSRKENGDISNEGGTTV